MRKGLYILSSIIALLLFSSFKKENNKAPEAILPIPSATQLEWQKMETYAFIHFGLNTYTDMEWGFGNADLNVFNPKKLDCEQWVRTIKGAGLKGVIITAKHHDGFCLWPTTLTEYCVRNTPYKNGKGNIVGDLQKACKKYGIKFGVYLSPWDRNHAKYGSKEYVEYYHKEMHDLLTNYGDLFEVWLDGANGGKGWYGGANENRMIDRKNYYNFPEIYKQVAKYHPEAVVFSDGGPGCRWVGNERGIAAATNWSFIPKNTLYPGCGNRREFQIGYENGDQWTAAECDVSIRPGWFYHPSQDSLVRSVDNLTDIYYRSVGHNGTLNLNFPVNRDGLIDVIDSTNAVNFYKGIQKRFSKNLFKGLIAKTSDTRGSKFSSKALTDNNYDTYWATNDGVVSGWIEFELTKATKINNLMIQEYIPLGQRIKSFDIECFDKGTWKSIDCGEEKTTIGYKRLLRFKTITAKRIRIRFIDSRACLCINNIEAYYTGDDNNGFSSDKLQLNSIPYTIKNVSDEISSKCFDNNEKSTASINDKNITFCFKKANRISSFAYLPDSSDKNKNFITIMKYGQGKKKIN